MDLKVDQLLSIIYNDHKIKYELTGKMLEEGNIKYRLFISMFMTLLYYTLEVPLSFYPVGTVTVSKISIAIAIIGKPGIQVLLNSHITPQTMLLKKALFPFNYL
ncbi:hypothetical protein K501DRAFT_276262 [Backusella circina FSU 941]|nr:hypothetical protein K501DRAFT_276262 [Backusella circina FSU 941]